MLPVANGEGVRPGAAAGQQVANLGEKVRDYFFLLAELKILLPDYFSQVRHSLEGVAQKGERGLHSQLPTQQRKDLNGTVFFFSP